MSKVKFLVSFAFALCLVLACGTCAFAAHTNDNYAEDFVVNKGDSLGTNYKIVKENHGVIDKNDFNHGNLAKIETNYGTVGLNQGYIVDNRGNVNDQFIYEKNSGYSPPPVVERNRGTVKADPGYADYITGNVIYNYDGKVSSNIEIIFDYHKLTSNLAGIALDSIVTVTHQEDMNKDGLHDFAYSRFVASGDERTFTAPVFGLGDDDSYIYVLNGADFTVEIPDGYTLRINGTGNSLSGTASVSNVTKNIELVFSNGDEPLPDPGQGAPNKAEPAKSSSVPATGDMSNMPLWGALLIGFAALAIATRKKKA